jgi:hypothetical protein
VDPRHFHLWERAGVFFFARLREIGALWARNWH